MMLNKIRLRSKRLIDVEVEIDGYKPLGMNVFDWDRMEDIDVEDLSVEEVDELMNIINETYATRYNEDGE